MNMLSQIGIGFGVVCFAGFFICFLAQEVPRVIREKDSVGLFLLGCMISVVLFATGFFLQ